MKAELKELLAKLTNTPIVVETGSNTRGTYRKWSDGTLEQWGLEASRSNSNRSVAFPIPFASNAYVILGTNTSGTMSDFMTSASSASSFSIYPVTYTQLFWIAIGKWK